ncbi:peptidyl-prolyl cis-trans isomerase [Moritella sp. Urea-trap-13]|uniref:peptidylprolyl isomerase n=1 Tax=Moritella sp. Urea-trap-13 TaxID=2058327 RepID=UPI000C3344C3|nr:peptidylprolyl isomerase [Moritella sp. Urea-trap-13]PKH09304.1 peptidyl-prolyl cis-trans isomerase [Moritella sp. Urea-trap-13]
MKQVFKEPLLVFLLIGAAIFVLFQQVADDPLTADAEIVVTEGHIQVLTLGFEKRWQRLPTERELEGLIQHYVREEVLYREALALGLDRDDTIIKRRLVQKLQFLSEDIATADEPEEQQLLTYLAAHQESYRQPSRFSFRQVYINASNHDENAQSEALKLLAILNSNDSNADTNADTLGDPLMLSHQFERIPETEVERALGEPFLQSLRKMPTGSWQGPITSGFGWHLVRIDERIDGKPANLNTVRKQVVRDWKRLQRQQANKAVYERLRKNYKVTVPNYVSTDSDVNSDIQSSIQLYMSKLSL